MKKIGIIILAMSCSVAYAENLQKTDNTFNVTTKKIFPEAKQSEFTFKVGVQTIGHDYGLSAGIGDSKNLDVSFSQSSDIEIEATYKRDAYGVYAKYRTDLEDPSLSLNTKSLFSDSSNYNFNIGGFFLYDDKTSIVFENIIDNSNATVMPKKETIFENKTLKSGNEYKFNVARKEHKIGISNLGSKKSNSYFDGAAGIKKDYINLPVVDKKSNTIHNARYSGNGVFSRLSYGFKSKALNSEAEKFTPISTTFDIGFSTGRLSSSLGKIDANRINFKLEQEYFLNKNSTVSYVSGSNFLIKETALSHLTGLFSILGTGMLGGSLAGGEIPSSIADAQSTLSTIGIGKTDGNAGDNMVISVAAAAAYSFIGSKVAEEIYGYHSRSYLNDTFYGVKFNYEF